MNLLDIKELHTLGPSGTNCERASHKWVAENNISPYIILHDSLEDCVSTILQKKAPRECILMGCIAYPDLHNLIFENISSMYLFDCYIMPTFDMVLAENDSSRRKQTKKGSVALHPAPEKLLESVSFSMGDRIFVESNTKAANLCAKEEADLCITTSKSAKDKNLNIVKNFGSIKMGFSIHCFK